MNVTSYDLLHAIRGPILLITLGGLIVCDYFAGFSFGRTWPILIIVFGVLKLLERAAGGPPPPVYPPPGAYPAGTVPPADAYAPPFPGDPRRTP